MRMRTRTDHEPFDFQRLAVETSPSGIVWIADDGHVLYANPAARALPWSDVEEVLLARWSRDPELVSFREDLRTRGRASIELRLDRAPQRGRCFSIEGRSFGDDHVLFVRDCTARRRLEEELADLRGVATLGEFTAAVVHDFGNLVTPMACITDALSREIGESNPAAPLVAELSLVSRRAVALLRHLLSFLRREPFLRQRVNVSQVIAEMLPLLTRLLGVNIEIVLSLDDAAGEALVDRLQLEHVILNLVANARDAMPRGGRITVRTHPVIVDETPSGDRACPGDRPYVALTVIDDGDGMPEDVRERALDPFFSTKASGQGTGLGLSSAHRFAVQAGGCITVRSEVGEGTAIALYLPRASEADDQAAMQERDSRTTLRASRPTGG